MSYCKIKNEDFKSFLYINGGWLHYEKCPVCDMMLHGDGSNYAAFWSSHLEDSDHEPLEL